VNKLQAELAEKRSEWEALTWMRDLFTATDDILEEAVLRAFNELGVKGVRGPPKRTDLLLRHGDYVFAIETKGYAGAAKEESINQCSRWVAETTAMLENPESESDPVMKQYVEKLRALDCYDGDGKPYPKLQVKGLIVANTYRETEPSKRPDMLTQSGQHFSEIYQTKVAQHKFTALTTLQLLGLIDARQSDIDTDAKITALAESSGILSEMRDSKNFLKELNEAVD
jgi:hypothetical protein